MYFIKDYMQQFRDSDEDGFIGVRGYINFFQDMATEYMHNVGRGNDTLPEEFGISWVYTKYKIHILNKLDFSAPITLRTWASYIDRVRVWQDLEVCQNGSPMMVGRMESCLSHLKEGRLAAIKEIELPEDLREEDQVVMSGFMKTPKKSEDEKLLYTYRVRYTDLDKSGHMNNLHYIELFLNAFGPDFYRENSVEDFEIHYISQSFYDDILEVYARIQDQSIDLFACKNASTVVAACNMSIKKA